MNKSVIFNKSYRDKVKNKNIVIVIYALDHNAISPWIYGVYKDINYGYKVQEEMENSEKYGHMM